MTEYKAVKVGGRKMDEHRAVVEAEIGRRLRRDEIVHHINGDKRDNRLSNLVIMDLAEHSRLHMAGRTVPEETKKRISRSLVGNRNARVLSVEDVAEIKRLRELGMSFPKIAAIIGTNKWTVGKIARGQTYK